MLHASLRRSPADLRDQAHPAEFEGACAKDVVEVMAVQLNTLRYPKGDLGIEAFMRELAGRVLVNRRASISVETPESFLADLHSSGVIHLWSTSAEGGNQ